MSLSFAYVYTYTKELCRREVRFSPNSQVNNERKVNGDVIVSFNIK